MRLLALFVFLSCLFFWPIFFGKVNLNGNLLVSFYAPFGENLPFKNTGWDQLRIYFPFYRVTLESIKNFEVPLWNPYAFSGHPHMADFQTAVFYPLNIFGLILAQIEFWHLLRITPTILAAFFTFLYLRSLKIANLAAVFGALTFGFSPFILTWGEEVVMSPHSIVWLPFILWAVEKFLAQAHPRGEHSFSLAHPGGVAGRAYLAIIALATAFSFLGGYMQTTIYMLIFVGGYLVFRILSHPRGEQGSVMAHPWGVLLGLLCAFALGVGIAAVQILPSAELFFNAARSEITLRDQLFNFLLPIESILTFFAPDFFGHPATANFFRFGEAQYYEGIFFVGIATLVFAGYLIIREWHQGFVKFLTISGIVSLLTVIDSPISRLFLSLPIPFLSTSIPNRVLFIPAFCLAVMAAGGFDGWISPKGREFPISNFQFPILKPILIIAGVYAGILMTLGLVKLLGVEYFEHKQFLTDANLLVTLRNLVVPITVFLVVGALILAADLRSKFKSWAAIAIIVISFLHIFYFSSKYFSFSDRKYIFPDSDVLSFIRDNQGIYRSLGIGDAFLENNFASQYGIYWPEGYDSLNNRAYGEFTYVMQGADISDFVFRADAGLGRGNTFELIENSSRRRLIDMVGVKYVIGKIGDTDVLEKNGFEVVFDPTPPEASRGGNNYVVFQNLSVLPRVFLASNYEGPPDVFGQEPKTVKEKDRREKLRRELIPSKLLGEDFDFRNVLILERSSPISAQFGEGTADVTSYRNQEVTVKTRSNQPKMLFLSDNWYPGWKATVDGDETEILRANYTFRAVPLTSGEHEVRFYYDSNTFKVGLMVSLLGIGVLVLLVFGNVKKFFR